MARSRQANNGLIPFLFGGFLILAMGIIHQSRQATHTSGSASETDTDVDDPKRRGLDYEEHVFEEGRLPQQIELEGGELKLHPRIFPPRLSMPAQYYRSPEGFDGGALLDAHPHAKAVLKWVSLVRGTWRIPDAIAHFPEGTQVLHELKCPNPWLMFDGGQAWVAKMQAAFASQALAFAAWAAQKPDQRKIVYGFCGRAPPWAEAILGDLRSRFPTVQLDTQDVFWASGFRPAERLVQRAARDAMMIALDELSPAELFGAAYDTLSD